MIDADLKAAAAADNRVRVIFERPGPHFFSKLFATDNSGWVCFLAVMLSVARLHYIPRSNILLLTRLIVTVYVRAYK